MTLTALLDVTTLNASDGYNIAMLVGNDGITVPEPSTWLLVAGGLLTLRGFQRTRQ